MKVRVVLNGLDVREIEVENGDPEAVATVVKSALGASTVLRGNTRLEAQDKPVQDGEEVYASTPTKPNGQ